MSKFENLFQPNKGELEGERKNEMIKKLAEEEKNNGALRKIAGSKGSRGLLFLTMFMASTAAFSGKVKANEFEDVRRNAENAFEEMENTGGDAMQELEDLVKDSQKIVDSKFPGSPKKNEAKSNIIKNADRAQDALENISKLENEYVQTENTESKKIILVKIAKQIFRGMSLGERMHGRDETLGGIYAYDAVLKEGVITGGITNEKDDLSANFSFNKAELAK